MGGSTSSSLRVASRYDERGHLPAGRGWTLGNGGPGRSTILVIEDEVLIRLAVCNSLRQFGYRVIEGSTAEEGQRVIRTGEPIEVLFSDVELGSGMDGLALAKWVRRHFPEVRILLTSGVARMGDQASGLSDGPFFSKPYSHELLETHIQRLLGAFGKRNG